MIVYFDPGFDSMGIGRIVTQMQKYLPEGNMVAGDPDSTELTVIHVIGRRDHVLNRAKRILSMGGQYAICQYVLESSRNPNPEDWREIWDGAKVVFSYYNLPTKNLYHAPLAADPNIFYKEEQQKKYVVGSNGYDFKNECIGEVQLATWNVGGRGVHVGLNFNSNPIVDYYTNIPDDKVREIYNSCEHWSALRRKDGFEMIAVEAMLCGIRPIMFDTPNYRQWFNDLVDFIPERGVDETSGNIKHILKHGPRDLSTTEINAVKNIFSWEKTMKGFWERCLN